MRSVNDETHATRLRRQAVNPSIEAMSWDANSASRNVETTRQKLAETARLAFWDDYVIGQQLDLNEQTTFMS